MDQELSIILPAKNEANSLMVLLPKLRERYPETSAGRLHPQADGHDCCQRLK